MTGTREPVMAWQFLRRHFVQFVFGAVLVVAAYFAISIYATYLREQRIAKVLASHGGYSQSYYAGPDWIPQVVRENMPLLDRVRCVYFTSDTKVSEASIEHLKKLTHLDSLELSHTQVTDTDLKLLKGLTNLKLLYFDNTKVTNAGLLHLKGLTNIEELGLGATHVTNTGLMHLKRLPQLRILYLGNTRVTDAGLVHLKGLTNLEELDVSHTQITDAGLEHLIGLTKLYLLNVEGTEVTAEGRAMFRKSLPNCDIEIEPVH